MIGAVYQYCAKKGGLPVELETAWRVDEYGAAAVFGRVLGVGEMRRMSAAKRVYTAYHNRENYRDRDGNKNFAEWAQRHEDDAELLNKAVMVVMNG